MKNKVIQTVVKAFSIGAAMTVPGISGGTLALILNVYDRILQAVSALISGKEIKKNLLFLITFAVSGAAGMFALSKVILALISIFPAPVTFFFIGAVVGGIPVIYGKTGMNTKKKKDILIFIICLILGAAFVLGLSYLPFSFPETESVTLSSIPFFIFVGFMLALALILPGVSFSHMLIVLGIYARFYEALHSLDLLFLGAVGIFSVLWVLAQIKLLEAAMKKFPLVTYSVILGFVIGSVKDIVAELPDGSLTGFYIPVSLLTLAAGAATTYFISRKENK